MPGLLKVQLKWPWLPGGHGCRGLPGDVVREGELDLAQAVGPHVDVARTVDLHEVDGRLLGIDLVDDILGEGADTEAGPHGRPVVELLLRGAPENLPRIAEEGQVRAILRHDDAADLLARVIGVRAETHDDVLRVAQRLAIDDLHDIAPVLVLQVRGVHMTPVEQIRTRSGVRQPHRCTHEQNEGKQRPPPTLQSHASPSR